MGVKMIPKLISMETLRILDDTLVAKQLCSEATGSEIQRVGDTVYFSTVSDVSVQDYGSNGRKLVFDKMDEGLVGIKVDQEKATAVEFDDIDEFQRKISMEGEYIQRQAYALSKDVDTFILGKYVDAGIDVNEISNSGNVWEINTASILDFFETMATIASENNLDQGEVFFVIPAWLKYKLMTAGIELQVNNGMSGKKGGYQVAEYYGFKLVVTNRLPKETDGTYHCMSGLKNAIRYIDQINKAKVDDTLSGDTFGTKYAHLHVYGGGVVSPDKLMRVDIKKIAEA